MANAVESISQFPPPQEFITEVPLYTEYRYAKAEEIIGLEFYNETVDTYCAGCGRDTVFKRRFWFPQGFLSKPTGWTREYSTADLVGGRVNRLNIEWSDTIFGPPGHIDLQDHIARDRIFSMDFVCTRDPTHHVYIFIRADSEKAVKVGQHPSLADLQKAEARQYRKVLGDKYTEFIRAIGLVAHGVGIGAFVYLRRIFEDLLERAHQTAMREQDWNEDAYQKSRISERISTLQHYLPRFLVDNKNVYSILSKGIHELTEDECLKYFGAVRLAIELILDEQLEALERAEKIKKATKEITDISGRIK